MRLAAPGRPHLTYCTNIHPGERWPDVRDVLARRVTAVKAAVAPDRPFGVGLRLSASAAEALGAERERAALAALLADAGLYVFTLNGFPYGGFHGTRVKEEVYLPDWRDPRRVAYADRLARLLAHLLPDEPDLAGSVSTVPGAFAARARTPAERDAVADGLLRHVATLTRIHAETGRTIVVALEPEPGCILETAADAIAFSDAHLRTRDALGRLGRHAGLAVAAAEAALARHLGVCLDVCHAAVGFEDPVAALAALARAGLPVAKIQLSAGLAVDGRDPDARAALRAFADDVYLHQVTARTTAGLRRFLDLSEALDAAAHDPALACPWRIHFHVPVFRAALGAFASTQPDLVRVLAALRAGPHAAHLEVETYTWDVLPPEHRGEDVVTAIARELAWVRERLEQ